MRNETPATPQDAPTDNVITADVPCRGCRESLRGLALDGNCRKCGEPVGRTLRDHAPSIDADGAVSEDVPCASCGYNLRTRLITGRCPECAAPVLLSACHDTLAYAPSEWVKRLANGAWWLLIGMGYAIFAPILALANTTRVSDSGDNIATVLLLGVTVIPWLGGLIDVTRRDPRARPRREGLSSRRIIRIGMCAMTLGGVLIWFRTATDTALQVLGPWGSFCSQALWIVGGLTLVVAFVVMPLAIVRHLTRLAAMSSKPAAVEAGRIVQGALIFTYTGSLVTFAVTTVLEFNLPQWPLSSQIVAVFGAVAILALLFTIVAALLFLYACATALGRSAREARANAIRWTSDERESDARE